MNRGGSMTGGSVSRSAGICPAPTSWNACRVSPGRLRERLQAARRAQEESEREQKAAQYELEVAEGQKRQAEDAVLKWKRSSSTTGFLLESSPALVKIWTANWRRWTAGSARSVASEQVERDVAALERRRSAGARSRALRGRPGTSPGAGRRAERTDQCGQRKRRPPGGRRETHSAALADLEQVCRDLLCDRASREALVNRYEAEIASLQNQVEEKMGTILRCGQTEKRSWQNWKRFRRKNWNWKQNALPRTGRAGRRTMRCCSWA